MVEIFLPLWSGARRLIVPTLGRFGRRVLQEEVHSAGFSLHVLALGGEACPSPALLCSWRQQGNCTHNIYGNTEVSCSAGCYNFPERLLQSTDLRPPLMETTMEVRDEDGCVVTQGEEQDAGPGPGHRGAAVGEGLGTGSSPLLLCPDVEDSSWLSGKTQWVFETGDAVKSCPTVDGHVYALDSQVWQCVWKHHCGSGLVFSSPCLHPSLTALCHHPW
ncbi:LOW QUALITY PROTEIN: beta-alanine-activating enzyme [Coregonus clupeaformis]|uniref:LOW QUALITY PROTEIN: beta-alanine-activating enzyme n=1 Tax=Coregonus clupeaformis TaxID=59861 RepID=UPI001E1C338F|nr:LOW QUALITY PROTEIN: beta-alanine-activating enzyme [Coregonus clupeaformis]